MPLFLINPCACPFSPGSGQPNYIFLLNHSLAIVEKVAQSYPTLCDPVDCGPPGFFVHGIFQARILEWVAIPFFRGSSQPRDQTQSPALQANSLPSEPPGKPKYSSKKHNCTA